VDDTLSVAEVSRLLVAAVEDAFPVSVWVRGQIRDLDRSRTGTVYFSLVDAVESGRSPDARVRVVLFPTDKARVNRLLVTHGAGRMDDGVEVRVRGRLGYHPGSGTASLRMTGIDPEYTLGRLAADRDRLIRALAAEGVLDRNRSLPLPLVPLRVAVVTSARSAAAADLRSELRRSGFAWDLVVVDVAVQGAAAVASISAGVATAIRSRPDVVALVRGGGARTDLAPFDAEQVARAIAASPVPVFTGIGHEVDESVADRVAHTSFKTPTACAAGLVALVAAYAGRVDALWEQVAATATGSIERAARRLTDGGRRLQSAVRVTLTVADGTLSTARRRMARAAAASLRRQDARVAAAVRAMALAEVHVARRHGDLDLLAARLTRGSRVVVAQHGTRLDGISARVRAMDPVRLLERGWSVTRDEDGAVVRSATAVHQGDLLTTTLADGTVVSRVEEASGKAEP
jgi:exodeoxyribonuclease VII large subunit